MVNATIFVVEGFFWKFTDVLVMCRFAISIDIVVDDALYIWLYFYDAYPYCAKYPVYFPCLSPALNSETYVGLLKKLKPFIITKT